MSSNQRMKPKRDRLAVQSRWQICSSWVVAAWIMRGVRLHTPVLMKTLQELLDDLDTMVDNGTAPKHEVRSLIAFIARQVAVFEDAHARSIDDHAKLQQAKAQRDAEADKLKAQNTPPSIRIIDQMPPSTYEPEE
jgi:hypothetical protein